MTAQSGHTEQCKRRPIIGSMVCHRHGGNLPRVRQAAKVRLARDKIQREALERLRQQGGRAQDTITEMDRLAAEVIAFKDIAREEVEALLEAGKGLGYEAKAGEQIRAAVTVYTQGLDRCNTVLSTNVKLGIAERKAKLDEGMALLVVAAVKNILNRLELSAEQKRTAIQVVPEELRAISAGPS